MLGVAGSVGSQIVSAVAGAEHAQHVADRVLRLTGVDLWLSVALPWIGMAVFIGVVIYALRAKAARIDAHRQGRTL